MSISDRQRTPARARTACRMCPVTSPCTELETRGGTWRYDANKLDQHFSPAERFSTGLRNGEGISFDSAGRIFATQHGRDQLGRELPQPLQADAGRRTSPPRNWSSCGVAPTSAGRNATTTTTRRSSSWHRNMVATAARRSGSAPQKQAPVAAFPAHWAPNDMLIYEGSQFPSAYKDGAFIAFHGSWNRAPSPQGGYNVVFQPLAGGMASGPFVVFADGFAGAMKEPGRAAHRPTGLAVAPDGALYIADDQGGRIWRVTYHGRNKSVGIAAAAPTPAGGRLRLRQCVAAGRRSSGCGRVLCRYRLADRRTRSRWAIAFSMARSTAGPARDVTAATARVRRWVPI